MLFWKMFSQGTAMGVSAKSLQMYSIVFFFRFASIVKHEGYLPFDKSGDWIYPAMEFLSLTMCGTALFLISTKYSDSYKPALDTFGAMDPVPAQFGTVFLVVPALLIALAVHPSLNNVWWSDICWTFALYLEAVAILPQLYMFQKGDGSSGTQKRVESFVSKHTNNWAVIVRLPRFRRIVCNAFIIAHRYALRDSGTIIVTSPTR